MTPVPVDFSSEISNGIRPAPSPHSQSKTTSQLRKEEARVIFDKTLAGHYRDGRTGYRNVGALFLTWADDDLQCKNTEVDKLRALFHDGFHFSTEDYQIPSERWDTALQKKVSNFCHKNNSPEDLAIIYYGGHAYEGEETKEFKLAAKVQNDGYGDPTAFFNDIRSCIRLPRCDQLMILDCCYAARAFTREHIGKRKFELLASSPPDSRSPAPHLAWSFTRALHQTLKRLLETNPQGFYTSHLYREVYHTMPAAPPVDSSHVPRPKPLLFDQARHSFGRIWLQPQDMTNRPPKPPGDGRYLKLTFRLNADPDLAVMNELALQLQFLPHVDQIRFEDLAAPREQITNFMRSVLLATKIRPLIRKLQARRQGRNICALPGQPDKRTPPSLIELHSANNHQPAYDWSSAFSTPIYQSKGTHVNVEQSKEQPSPWPTENDMSSNIYELIGPSGDPNYELARRSQSRYTVNRKRRWSDLSNGQSSIDKRHKIW